MSFEALRRGAGKLVETGWVSAFRSLRPLANRPDRIVPAGGQRILVVAPHPDDETAGCAGTLLRHVQSGDSVAVAWMTDGGSSRALGLTRDEMSTRRRQEATAAAAVLGIREAHWFGLPEGQWADPELAVPLRRLLDDVRPHVLYAPSRIDFHPEHVRIARVLSRVLPDEVSVRVYQIHVPLTRILTNTICDVSASGRTIVDAIEAYPTQRGSLLRVMRTRRYAAARYGAGSLVEEFCAMSAEAYRATHQVSHEDPPFRGIRHAPTTDPLAYWHGRRVRRQFRKAVHQFDVTRR